MNNTFNISDIWLFSGESNLEEILQRTVWKKGNEKLDVWHLKIQCILYSLLLSWTGPHYTMSLYLNHRHSKMSFKEQSKQNKTSRGRKPNLGRIGMHRYRLGLHYMYSFMYCCCWISIELWKCAPGSLKHAIFRNSTNIVSCLLVYWADNPLLREQTYSE